VGDLTFGNVLVNTDSENTYKAQFAKADGKPRRQEFFEAIPLPAEGHLNLMLAKPEL
jgi:hypothetical protein